MYYPEHEITKHVGRFSYLKLNMPVVTPIDPCPSPSPSPNPNPYHPVAVKKTNRALEGDIVYYEPILDSMLVEIKGLKERHTNHNKVVGVLQFNSP